MVRITRLPGRDGLDICREVRSFSDVPMVMLTAWVEEIDRLLGLEFGADNYIRKPFSPREVVARIKAILRRARSRVDTRSATLIMDDATHHAVFHGTLLDLTPVEFRLLKTLAAAPGRVFSRDRLLDNLYLDHRVVTDRTVDSHIKNWQCKQAQVAPGRDPIRSIYGVGYKLEID
jgi:two-component system, OmpR family, response regulator BaeR